MAPPEIAVLLYDNRKCKIVVKDADMCILEGAPGKRCTLRDCCFNTIFPGKILNELSAKKKNL